MSELELAKQHVQQAEDWIASASGECPDRRTLLSYALEDLHRAYVAVCRAREEAR